MTYNGCPGCGPTDGMTRYLSADPLPDRHVTTAEYGETLTPTPDPLSEDTPLRREPIGRWWLIWTLYGLPRCSQAGYPASAPHCWRLIWPWQGREIRNGSPVHVACLSEAKP
jgi:hypothetical protein